MMVHVLIYTYIHIITPYSHTHPDMYLHIHTYTSLPPTHTHIQTCTYIYTHTHHYPLHTHTCSVESHIIHRIEDEIA